MPQCSRYKFVDCQSLVYCQLEDGHAGPCHWPEERSKKEATGAESILRAEDERILAELEKHPEFQLRRSILAKVRELRGYEDSILAELETRVSAEAYTAFTELMSLDRALAKRE